MRKESAALLGIFMAVAPMMAANGNTKAIADQEFLNGTNNLPALSLGGKFSVAGNEAESITLKAANAAKADTVGNLVAVAVVKGPDNMEAFNKAKDAIIAKMASKGVNMQFFVKPVDKDGAGFQYFTRKEASGHLNFEEFVGLLPLIVEEVDPVPVVSMQQDTTPKPMLAGG